MVTTEIPEFAPQQAPLVEPFYREMKPEQLDDIKTSLVQNFFAGKKLDLGSEAGQNNLNAHVLNRYGFTCKRWIPWISRFVDVPGSHVVEIGSGTGSITCAFGAIAGRVDGFDIDEKSVRVADDRAKILGLENTFHHYGPPNDIPALIQDRAQPPVDIVSLYATLEHQTLQERQASLALAWRLVREGGVIVIGQTPNLLSYFHPHTSKLPFFDMLPDWVKFRYLEHMPESPFRSRMIEFRDNPKLDTEMALTRWGRGMSFHEFEIAYAEHGPLSELVVGYGFEPEILAFNPIQFEEKLLMSYMLETRMDTPIAFARRWLTLVIRKPVPGAARAQKQFDASILKDIFQSGG